MDLSPGETELGDQDLRGTEFVEPSSRKKGASQNQESRKSAKAS